jgi:hypothetical protein
MKCIEKLRPVWLPSLSVAVDSVYQCVTPVKVLKGPVADSPSRASGGATGWPLRCHGNQRVGKRGIVVCQNLAVVKPTGGETWTSAVSESRCATNGWRNVDKCCVGKPLCDQRVEKRGPVVCQKRRERKSKPNMGSSSVRSKMHWHACLGAREQMRRV